MSTISDILAAAQGMLGTNYVWGGTDPKGGVDCSGFVLNAFAAAGIQLPRMSNAQARAGQAISQDQAQPGDLVWWDLNGRNDGADHIGIYLGNGKVIEASSSKGQVVVRNLWGNAQFTRVSGAGQGGGAVNPVAAATASGSAPPSADSLSGSSISAALDPNADVFGGAQDSGGGALDFDLKALWNKADESDPGEDEDTVGPYGVAAMMLRRQAGGTGLKPIRPGLPPSPQGEFVRNEAGRVTGRSPGL